MISEALKALIQVTMVLIGCGMISEVYIGWRLKNKKANIKTPENIELYDIGTKVYFFSSGEIVEGKIKSYAITYEINAKGDNHRWETDRKHDQVFNTLDALINHMKKNIEE